jgi:hypothetical protein
MKIGTIGKKKPDKIKLDMKLKNPYTRDLGEFR